MPDACGKVTDAEIRDIDVNVQPPLHTAPINASCYNKDSNNVHS